MKWLFSIILITITYTASLAQTYSLDHYLELAKNNSPLLKDLHNQVASNQLDSLRLRAGLKPQVTANSGGLYAPVIDNYGYSPAITNVHTLNALMGVNQAIISKKNVNEQVATIDLQSQSVANSTKISEQPKKAITAQYITAYGDLQQFNFNREVVDLLLKEEDILKKLTRANVYRQSDYLTFLVTLKQQQLQLSQSRAVYKNDYATLNYLAGVADTSIAANLARPDIQRAILPTPASSIYFTQFHLDSLKLINSRHLLDYTYKPKINAFADGGYNSDFTVQPYKNFGASIGFSFTMPIYDGGQKKLQYKKIDLQEQTRENYKAFFDVQYRQQIAQLNQQINENESLLAQVDDQMKYSESLIKVDNQLLQTGDLKIADLILAINNYLTVKNLLTQTTVSRLQLINQLNYWNK